MHVDRGGMLVSGIIWSRSREVTDAAAAAADPPCR